MFLSLCSSSSLSLALLSAGKMMRLSVPKRSALSPADVQQWPSSSDMCAYRIYQDSTSDDSPHSERGGIVQVHTSYFEDISIKTFSSKIPKVEGQKLSKVNNLWQKVVVNKFDAFSPGKKRQQIKFVALPHVSRLWKHFLHTVVHPVLDLLYCSRFLPAGAFQLNGNKSGSK